VPSWENPHETPLVGEAQPNGLHRMGLMTAVVIGLHNFPEGFATMFATQTDSTLGATIGLAIGIHNIPEGIAVAVPILYATKSRSRAFWFSMLSGAVPGRLCLGAAVLLAGRLLRTTPTLSNNGRFCYPG
jgi:ZIP family zinc transporter